MGSLHVEVRDTGVAEVTLDHPEKKVNTLSPALVDEFEAVVLPVLEDPAVRAAVIASAKPDTFIAGADLEVLEGLSAEQAEDLSRRGNELLCRVHSSPKPVVAAVHGAALGGGLEVALAAHFILGSDDPATVLGLPEVMLGLLPGGGGTQRLVRRIGLIQALPMLLTGKRIRARQAYRLGLVDALTTPGGIAETASRAALALAEGRLQRRRRRRNLVERLSSLAPVRSLILSQARRQVARRTRGLYPAPGAILDCVATGLSRGTAAGLERESVHFGRLTASPESRSLVWLFQSMNELKGEAEDGQDLAVARVAVLGAGLMGAGIASVSLGQAQVVLRDVADDALRGGLEVVEHGLARQLRSGAIRRNEADRRRSRLLLTTDLDDIAGAGLVIEAVPEDLDLKRRVLAEVEQRLPAHAVVASNTSALPIAAIAEGARHPRRVVGMHYFSPVPKMPLLEIVAPEGAADRAVAVARACGQRQGKTCIVVRDRPGFYTTRILAPYLNEAMLLLEEGARIEAIDRALKDWGFPVGPMALIDEVGVDVAAHVAQDLGAAFADRGGSTSDLPARLVEAGRLGRKAGRGLYVYPRRGRKRPDARVYELVGGPPRRPVAPDEMQERLALLMVNEAVHCLEERVVASARDGDVGAILGLGFPPFRAGPFHHVDAVGAAAVRDRLLELGERYGPRFQPAPLLERMAAGAERFYP
jgi:3-hydroxyacyl-CoA dehydrogenase/enoyl-CoA hydratase/carnithine racemase